MKTYYVKYADETKTKLLDYVDDPESAIIKISSIPQINSRL